MLLVGFLGDLNHLLLVLLNLFLHFNLYFFVICVQLFPFLLNKILLLVPERLAISSITFFVKVDWVVVGIIWNVLCVTLMIKLALQLNKLIASFIFLLGINFFHIFIDFLLVFDNNISLVL